MLVLSLAEVGDCRGGWSHKRRRLLADFLGGGGRQLRMSGLDTLLERLTFLELLTKESRNVALGQEVIKLFAGVHGVSHKHRCRQVIARYLHVLNLMSLRIEESITKDYGTAILQIVHKSHREIGSDRNWSFQVLREIIPQTGGLAAKDRFDAFLGILPAL